MARGLLLTLASALCLLVCVATVVLWVRSMWICDVIVRPGEPMSVDVVSSRGRVYVEVIGAKGSGLLATWDWQIRPAKDVMIGNDARWRLGGFGVHRRTINMNRWTATSRVCIVPHWALAALFGVMSVVAYRGSVRRWQQRTAAIRCVCAVCSYSLIGNTSGVCPECGEAIKSKTMPHKDLEVST